MRWDYIWYGIASVACTSNASSRRSATFRPVCVAVRYGYLVDEVAGDVVLIDSTNWREIVRFPSAGMHHATWRWTLRGRWWWSPTMGDGTTALFALDDRGLPTGDPDCYRHTGNGPGPDRQAGPHAHWVGFAPDGTLYAADLGNDCVLGFSPNSGRLSTAKIVFTAPPGSGPRQIAFHPDRPVLYLLRV